MDLSIILPVYNEEENVIPVSKEIINSIEDFKKENAIKEYELLLIDDGSNDKSFEKMKEIKGKYTQVSVIKFRKNFGQSAALQAGFDYSKGEVVVAMDSDGQNDPKDIPRLLKKLDEYDCVSGWRRDRRDPFTKRFFSKIASLMRRPFLGSNVHDFGCTLKAYRKDCLKDIRLYGEMHRYIPPLLRWKGYKVGEVVVNHRQRRNGKTKYGGARIIKGFLDMLNMSFWQKFSERPLHIFGGLGILISLLGFLGGVYSIYMKIFHRMDLSSHFISVASFLAVILGVQFFISGLLADISIRGYHSASSQKPYNIKEVL